MVPSVKSSSVSTQRLPFPEAAQKPLTCRAQPPFARSDMREDQQRSAEYLVQHYSQGEHVRLLVVGLVGVNLGRHVDGGARLLCEVPHLLGAVRRPAEWFTLWGEQRGWMGLWGEEERVEGFVRGEKGERARMTRGFWCKFDFNGESPN